MYPTPFPCPHCGHVYQLDANYLAAYGGSQTQCVTCRQAMTIPVGGPPAGYQQTQGYQQQQQVQFPGGHAYGGPAAYGAPTAYGAPAAAPYGQPQALAYAAPVVQHAVGLPAWREGKRVLVASGTELPECCVKCGQSAPDGKRYRNKKFSWHEQWVSLLVLLSPIVYIIVAMVLRKQGTVSFTLCRKHASKKLTAILISWGVVALGPVLIYIGADQREEGLIPLGIITFIGGLIAVVLTSRTLIPTKIENNHLWLKGAGEPFLASLPPSR